MSLINRMLQDLDARAGQPGAAPLPSDVRPVPAPARAWPLNRVAIAAGVAAVVTAAGFAGWRFFKPKATPAPVAVAAPAAAPVLKPAAPAAAVPVVAFEVPVAPRQDLAGPAAPVAEAAQVDAPAPVAKPAAPVAAKAAIKPASPVAAKPVRPAAAKPVAPAKGGREETPTQRAENAYRRALASLEDGRVTEAIAGLQAALKVDPRHEPARQTLVGLLVEAKRLDEAMRQLQAGLALDPAQPAMAMLLARLQIERGGSGIETLMRSLPHAAGNGDYHAFLAGALAREGRQREAAEHYGAALRTAPQNGVWWMGLGISLQAEKRNLEAAGAFQKALDSGTLSGELQGFVERKLKQLNR
ncbi:tetratricopeptide repeat protein [Massilia sp. LC238]|uniref:tetratricopeptide repeat protein n=1 Tax=Massilia sp. LC238 TaxID=1502852 RepID=UPI0004E392BD|nr:tetratricopeptide repeat protein [Massilia sp. LC238]KFC65150.1 putative PEP-CTERM system TPR-repeat lipoprotein [Massilia sp. LC238]